MTSETHSQADADARMTGDRSEVKYLLDPSKTVPFAKLVAAHLSQHRFEGDGANRLPRAQHWATTIYFDTADRALYRAARDSDHNVKLRAREYYDLHPELTETATDPLQLVRFIPVLWIELKFKRGNRTTKRRVGIPKAHVPAFFEHGEISDEMVKVQEQAHGKDAPQVLEELSDFRNQYDSPLRASCLVNYRRNAWQDEAGELRVTLDRNLASYTPPETLWTRDYALVRDTLGLPCHQERRHILEVKSRNAIPPWLDAALTQAGATTEAFSKFLNASRAVRPEDSGEPA